MDKNNREIGLKDVEIRQLKDMLRDTEDKMHVRIYHLVNPSR